MTEADLVRERAGREWLRGDVIQLLVTAAQLDNDRYRVRGLDDSGNPLAPGAERAAEGVLGLFVDDGSGNEQVAVRGDHPGCAAVGLYRAVRHDHAWLVLTSHRFAVLRLRDRQSGTESAVTELMSGEDRSLGGALRGLGKFVKASASELAKSVRRPPLAERPEDAELVCEFEAPRQAVAGVERWKPPLMPQLRGAPRHVQIHFTDNSWARIQTDENGATALTGPPT